MPLLVRVVHKDIFIVWCITYLRLLKNVTPFTSSTYSVETSRMAWEIAAAVAQASGDANLKEANIGALFID
jgi:hypothetical protein